MKKNFLLWEIQFINILFTDSEEVSNKNYHKNFTKNGGKNMAYKFTTANFEEEVLNADVPVLVDFYAEWCGPCKMMAPIVEKLAVELEGKMKIGKCNTDENMPLAQKYRIVSIPTFMIFKNGQVVETFKGAMSISALRAKCENFL